MPLSSDLTKEYEDNLVNQINERLDASAIAVNITDKKMPQ